MSCHSRLVLKGILSSETSSACHMTQYGRGITNGPRNLVSKICLSRAYLRDVAWIGSDIIYLNIAGQSCVALDSLKAVTELLERRSLIYSDRPSLPMNDLIGLDFAVAIVQYGRRLFGFSFRKPFVLI